MIFENSLESKVTIVGDTSRFHLGSNLNYTEFCKLIATKHRIIQEIPYDAFGVDFITFDEFLKQIKKTKWWSRLCESDIILVHGEGLTEKCEDYVYPYLYFSKIGSILGIESCLVNFSMYEAEPFLELLKDFSYIACRDMLTLEHLRSLGLDPELSFDCCVLGLDIEKKTEHDGSVALIKGRHGFSERLARKFGVPIKYNCCWAWEEDAIHLPSVRDYVNQINNAQITLSTSFHGNIISFLSGIPFISLDKSNRKYQALDAELLPKNKIKILRHPGAADNRKRAQAHYGDIINTLRERARLNCV